MKVRDVLQVIDDFAPFASQMQFDHSGLQVGDLDADVTGVMVAVDLTMGVIDEALRSGCNLIVSHHPAVWEPLATVCEQDYTGRLVSRLVREGVHYVAAHTNVDACRGGNSERLAEALGGTVTGRLSDPCAVTFAMEPITLDALLAKVRTVLGDPYAYAVGNDDPLTAGALCTGAGGDDDVIAECVERGLVYLTGEVKHHQLRYVAENGGHLICFGHFTSEKIFVRIMVEVLQEGGVRALSSCQDSPIRG